MTTTVADPTLCIRSWHAHVYFEGPAQRELAVMLRERIAARFEVQLGRWHDALVGPHTRPMYMVAFEPTRFGQVLPFLALNRQGLDVLVHPNTLAPRADHLVNAIWLGQRLPLNEATLPEIIADDEVEPVLINNRPG